MYIFNVLTYLKEKGYSCIDSDFYSNYIDLWDDWYKGEVDSFHKYSIYNGIKIVGRTRKTIGISKLLCEDWANLLLNEKVQINVDEGFQNEFNSILKQNDFYHRANQLIELSFALGTGALIEYTDNKNNIAIDYITADMIYPLSWDNGRITECAFASEKVVNKTKCIYLNIHVLEKEKYVIYNKLFNYETGEELIVKDIKPKHPTNSNIPYFQIIKPNIVNNIDYQNPMGISVFANSISLMQGLDLVYDSYCNEFDLGKKRIMIPMSMVKFEQTKGNVDGLSPVFDTNDTVFYAIPGENNQNNKPIEFNMSIRATEHEQGIQTQLNLISKKSGLGNDRYNFEKGGIKTATEVISENSDLFQNLKKHELLLTDTLTDMVNAICKILSKQTNVTIMFDDSIINDDNTKIDNNIKLVQAGLKSKISALMDIYGYDREKAQTELQAIIDDERMVSGSDIDLFGGDNNND